MATRRITERVVAPFAGARVDREAGVIYGVKLCGLVSANERDYLPETFRRDIGKYDGATIHFDHARERTVAGVGGKIRNPRVDESGVPRGDAHLLKSHPNYGPVMEAAQLEAEGRGGGLYGFSHVVMAKTSRRKGREVVEGIERVESVDIVAVPATTTGFFESREGRAVEKIPFRTLLEALLPKLSAERAKPARKWLVLAEDDAGMAPMLDTPVDAPADDATGDDAMDDAFKQLMHTSLDKLLDESHSLGEFLKNIRAIYKTRAQVTGNGKATDDAGDDAGKSESVRPLDSALVLSECKALQFSPSYEQGEHLRAIPSPDTRKVVVEAWKAAAKATAAEPPVSHGRDRAGRVTEQKADDAAAPPTLDEIKKRFRG